MAVEVTMPQMGADMTEGTLVKWLKQPGDQVTRGEIIAEIETDKATVELEAFDSGTVIELRAKEGDTVPVGDVIAMLGEAGEVKAGAPSSNGSAPSADAKSEEEAPAQARTPEQPPRRPVAQPKENAPQSVTEHVPDEGESLGEGRVRISPVARRIATDNGIDVRGIKGSGPDGRILRKDVEDAIKGGGAAAATPMQGAAQPISEVPAIQTSGAAEAIAQRPTTASSEQEQPETAPVKTEDGEKGGPTPAAAESRPTPRPAATGDVEALSRMRQAIARRMSQSKQQQPHYYLTLDIDMGKALAFRSQLNAAASETQKVSINDLIVKACAIALERHPHFNAEFTEAGLKVHEQINICIGIALDEGLIAPAILDCGHKSLGHIAAEAKDVINRAKSGKLRADEYSAGTFTITNLGAFGVETLIGIINPPQAAILGVGSVMDQPVVRDGAVVVGSVMKVALSADHRVTDGAEGARFIKEIQGLLENPASLAL